MSLIAERIVVTLGGARILDDVLLTAGAGETVAVVGPSGSGKTTLLRVVAGLQRPDAGRVVVGGADVTGVAPHRRGVGLLFQDDALFPHRDVRDNVAFGLRMAGRPVSEIEARTAALLALVGLPGHGRRSVRGLSGGERKRVALARALAPAPQVLLLDEPLGALDRPLRDRLLGELRSIFDEVGVTVVVVTHDVGEAFALADRVAVLREGRVVQAATPEDLWRAPASAWVARFLGIENVEEDEVAGRARIVRPEAVLVEPSPGGEATVVSALRTGPLVRLGVRTAEGRTLVAVTTRLGHPHPGDRVSVRIDPAGVLEVPLEREPTSAPPPVRLQSDGSADPGLTPTRSLPAASTRRRARRD